MSRQNPDDAGWNVPRILWIVLVVALLIRLWGIGHGLPFSYINDEYHEVMRALQLGAGSFNFDRIGKGGFYLLLFVEYGLYFVWLKLTGAVASAEEFARMFARDPSAFYLMGRATAALCGVLTVTMLYQVGRKAYSKSAGLLAALFLAINVLHIDLSRRIGVDVPMVLLATVALYFALGIVTTGRRTDYLLAVLFAALATTTKLPGVLVLLPLLVAHTYNVASTGGGARTWIVSRNLWLAAAVFCAVLVVTNPSIIFVADVLQYTFGSTPGVDDEVAESAVAAADVLTRPNLYVFYFDAMVDSMGWPLMLLGLAGSAYALIRRAPADVMLLSYAAVNYVVIASTNSASLYYPRYALPIIVVLVLLAGRVLAELVQWRGRPHWAVLAAVLAALLIVPARQAGMTAYALTKPDSRTLAKEWFEANVPAGSKVLIEGGKIGAVRQSVPLQDSRAAMQRRIEYFRTVEPRQAEFLERKLAVHEGVGYDLQFVRLDSIDSLDSYAAQGVEYFVVRPHTFLRDLRRAGPGSATLLSDLRTDRRVTLLKRFDGDSPEQIGPTIEIYRLRSEPGDAPSKSP